MEQFYLKFYTMLFILNLLSHSSLTSTIITTDTLKQGSSLLVQRAKTDLLISKNGLFSAGFFPVGENAFSFAVWFLKSREPTVVWTANRNEPVNGHGSKLRLSDKGNLVLFDTGNTICWSTKTATTQSESVKLHLRNDGNLVLTVSSHMGRNSSIIWESFKYPTDTLLSQQKLTQDSTLVSAKSKTNYSSGYYKLFFDSDSVLKMLFQGPNHEFTSIYWPSPWLKNFENGRFTYNNTKTAFLDSSGFFYSSDNLVFPTADYRKDRHRRMTLDPDGNLRIYSFNEKKRSWVVTWQAFSQPCRVHGICGPNSFCIHDHSLGRECHCAQGYKMRNETDWFYGCEPEFRWKNYTSDITGFFQVKNAEFYGYDLNYFPNRTLRECKDECLNLKECVGLQYKFDGSIYVCFHKFQLLNGHQTTGFNGDVYIRVPKSELSSYKSPTKEIIMECPTEPVLLPTDYKKPHQNGTLKVLVWVSVGVGSIEVLVVAVILSFLYFSRKDKDLDRVTQGYALAAARSREFSYSELRKATLGFRDEIGSGAGGTVYKGTLADGRVAAIKRLREANRGELVAEFLAEVSTIGWLNHMNLIEMWGYCAEGKHRLLVYEFMEHGSLADSLAASDHNLDWEKRFDIAVGTAKGLAYLHEECLEWVLHCDVKPHNILLSSDYQPKVADFGLSKLRNRGESHGSSFSGIRGTRGYMAPEWVYNLPITSKVDVYSYGIVVLELVTGRRPTGAQVIDGGDTAENGRLVTWVREKKKSKTLDNNWIDEIVDPILEGLFDVEKMEVLLKVALQCVEEDRENRPTMRQVVEMLHCAGEDEQYSEIFN